MKHKQLSRILSMLLTLALFAGMLPVSALAAEGNFAVQVNPSANTLAEGLTVITPNGITTGSTYGASENINAANLINSSGMSGIGLDATCSNGKADASHWHTEANPGGDAWVQVDLGEIYLLDELWIWNMNQAEANGRGFKNVKIEYSETGEAQSWIELEKPTGMAFEGGNEDYPFQFAQASGQANQAATNLNDGENTPVSFDSAKARYVKLTATPTAGDGTWGADGYYGLSELRFTGAPATVTTEHEVTYSLTHLTGDGTAKVADEGQLNFTLTAEPGFKLPDTIAVAMVGAEEVAYTYDITTGAVCITSVTGDVAVTATGVVQQILPEPDTGNWKMQTWGKDTNLEVQPGWLTPASEGVGFTLNYGAMYPVNSGNVVVYNTDAPAYANSVLEFDLTSTGAGVDGSGYRFASFPRFQSGKNCDGMAIGFPAGLEHSSQVNGEGSYPGVPNELEKSFVAGETYHLKFLTVGDTLTAYVDGKRLTSFTTNNAITQGKYGFRVWGQVTDKTVTVSNLTWKEHIVSTLGKSEEIVKLADWGTKDVTIPVTFGTGDTVASIQNGDTPLTATEDYAVSTSGITLKKEYITKQDDSFALHILFAKGSESTFSVTKLDTARAEYVWTPDKGIDEWTKLSGNGTFAMEPDNSAMRVTGNVALVNTKSPMVSDGEVEITFAQQNDDFRAGLLFRGDTNARTWQGVQHDSDYALMQWYFKNSTGVRTGIHGDGTFSLSRDGEADTKLKARVQGDVVTLWLDDQIMSTGTVAQAASSLGRMGLLTGDKADLLVKKVIFRNVLPFAPEADDSDTVTIQAEGGSMKVFLAADFPRVKEYTLDSKNLKGAEFKYNYVTINTVDYPATATAEMTGDSVTYHVVPEGIDVTFDVVFKALKENVLDMRIKNIVEPEGELVYTIGLPNQPLISANSTQAGARLDATIFQEAMQGGNSNWEQGNLQEVHYTIAEDKIAKNVDVMGTIDIITTEGLSASITNNVLNNVHELKYRAFDLPGGGVSAGIWNTDFLYRGLDGAKMFPHAAEPGEADLYCKVVLTEDTNDDNIMDWQDGANALKTILGDRIPGGDQAARSFFQVGYNFVSEAQQPFLQVEDNLKRMSNLIDGFDQLLILKGYANEGHDSAHADYDDINKRAGGAEDLAAMSAAIKDINSIFGVHINHTEAYPEAAMYNSHVVSDKNAWAWMDQSQNIRREADILNTAEGQRTMDERLDSMFAKASNNGSAPGIGFVYVDTYSDDRWCEARITDNIIGNGAMMGTENKIDMDRFASWVHWPGIDSSSMHHFVYNTQKDVYNGNGLFWGGYERKHSYMSWQHGTKINPIVEQFYTNQLPQKYLMCHDVRKMTGNEAIFEGGVRSTSDKKIYKDDHLVADGAGKIFIPWFAEDSVTKNPDEAAKIYHWNASGGETTWYLPGDWNVQNVYLYENTQAGKKLVETIEVKAGQVTIDAKANTPYTVYPGEAAADVTEWSVGSPIKDTGFNSRDFSIWQKTGEANIQFNDNGDGVSILTMEGVEAGSVSQTMTGLIPGQKYRALVWAGAENGKTARITVETPDGKTYTNYVDQIVRGNECYDTYARGMRVERVWVDFIQPEGETTAIFTLSADACEAENGKATFMESRIVKTADPGLPTNDETKKYVAYETFEYVEQGGTGIFTPEGGGDGGYHLSGSHPPYTDDAIAKGPNREVSTFSLKKQSGQMRTYPATMRLMPNTNYIMEFDTLSAGTAEIVSEADGSGKPLRQSYSAGHTKLTFTTGDKTDYIARIEDGYVLDNFQVYSIRDLTPPTTPTGLTATARDNNRVVLSWNAATDEDGRVTGYKIYRDGEFYAQVGAVRTYTDSNVAAYTGYSYKVSAVNAGGTEGDRSAEASAFVGADATAPAVVNAVLNSATKATLTFNKVLERTSAETAANYHLSGSASVTDATLAANGKTVTLTLGGMSAIDGSVLRVVGVKDMAGNATIGDQAITLSNLAHYFKFDEAEGTTAYDFTGREDAVKATTVTTVDGKNGKAAQFAADGYVDVSGNSLVNQNEFTLSAWIKWGGVTGVSQTIFSNGASGDAGSHGLWFHIRKDSKLWASSNQCGDINSGSVTVPVGEWVHVAIVRKATGNDLYLGGVKVGSNDTPDNVQGYNSKMRIGGNYNTGNGLLHTFKGGIDEFRIYTAALTEADIGAIAAETFAPAIIGDAFTVEAGANQPLPITVNFNGAGLASIKEGQNALIEDTDYTISDNAVIFTGAYLTALTVGEHVYTLTFDDTFNTTATITITVAEKQEIVDRTLLMQTIYWAQQMKEADYPDKVNEWAALQLAITAAITASEKSDLTAAQVAEEAAKLQAAMDAVDPHKAVIGVSLEQRFVRMEKDGTRQLTATVLPSSATEKSLSWASTNPNAATVDASGMVTAVAPGTTVITATTTDGGYTAACTIVVDGYLRTWYTKPASNWSQECLPIGNGNLGGMVYGKTDKEQIQVNEITLWSGGPKSSASYSGGNNAGAWKNLKGIQNEMFKRLDGNYSGINVGGLLGNLTGYGAYQNLGDITMDFTGAARTTATPDDYLRELDLADGMARVSYTNEGVYFTREYIASNPGNVMAIRMTADQENALAFKLAFTTDNTKTFITKSEGGIITCQGKVNSSQMAFAVRLQVVAPGADLTDNNDGTVTVANGEDVLILMTAGTNYDIAESKNIHEIADFHTGDGDYLDNNDPNGDEAALRAARRIDEAATLGYTGIVKNHMADYQEIFGRVTLDLGDADKADLPTDELIRSYKTNRDGYTEMLLFQFGRYALLSSSRDSLPANLQGIWNNSNSPGWNSDYHFNVNLQMNYWPAFVTNMSETGKPLVDFMDSLRNPGNVTAREHFGTTNGWVVNTQVTPFGMTGPGPAFDWGFTPGSGAWTCQNLWDYYQFTQDPEVLEAIYPILKENAQFWLEYLVEDPRTRVDGVEGTGELVTAPAGSSEHGPIGVGTTYDMSLAYMSMADAITAATKLGVDAELCAQIQTALDRMKPFQIGDSGQLKEWREETTYSSLDPGAEGEGHRHLSHLLGMYPGNLITQENSQFSDYYDAAVTALALRGEGSGNGTGGWSMAQKANTWARVGDSEKALHFLNVLAAGAIYPNLFDHIEHGSWGTTFQIDGNFGFTSAVAEMLLQSHQGFIQPLPALPTEWADGSYTGLVARGNFETDAIWANKALTRFTVRSGSGGECVVRYPNIANATLVGAAFTKVDADTVKFDTTKGGEYVFTNIPERKPVSAIAVTSPSGIILLEQMGQTIQLAANVAPANASDPRITWSVTKENGGAATSVVIDQNGLLTATENVAVETVKVTATAKDGSGIKGELLISVATDRTGGEGENVALNRPVTMTGATIYDRDDLKLANINDGSRTTRMAVANEGQQEIAIQFDFELEATKSINRVELYEYLDRVYGANGRIDKIEVQVPDGDDWETVAAINTPDDMQGNGSRQLTLSFEPVITDRVRIQVTDNEKAGPTIWELEVYGTTPMADPADKTALRAKLEESAFLTEEDFAAAEADWVVYTTAREAAIAVVNDPAATQAQVDAALVALTEAIGDVVHMVTVTFDAMGGSMVAPVTVAAGGKIAHPAAPTRSGYTFGGWYKDVNYTAAWDFENDVVTGDITLYAKWAENTSTPPSGGSTEKPPVVTENPDGSKTTTETDKKTGAITETTEWPDGKTVETITEKNGNKTISVTDKDGNKVAEISLPAEVSAPEKPFTDVPEDHWSKTAVDFVAGMGLFTGASDGAFSGEAPMTRGMLTTVLHRLSGKLPGGENSFGDVKDGAWYADSVAWAAGNGIVTGNGAGFDPDGNITRESLAVMLYRYAGLLGLDTKTDGTATGDFGDSTDVSSWAADAMSWAVSTGIIKGSNNALNPGDTASRAEVAAMLQRFVENLK